MIKGSCLCGGVHYRVDGPVHSASHCHCTMCQKQHGAACGSYANVARADFVYERGAELVTEYNSSPGVTRGFCRVCGSNLTWHSLAAATRIAVTLGTLEPPYEGPVERELYTDTKVSWLPTK